MQIKTTLKYQPHTDQNDRHQKIYRDFAGDPVAKNLACHAGDAGLIPDLGRSHTPQGNVTPVPHLGSSSRKYYSPCASSLCFSKREATAKRSLCIASREWPPLAVTRASLHAAVKTQGSQKIKK